MIVKKDFLKEDVFKNLKEMIGAQSFPWFYEEPVFLDKKNKEKYNFRFNHTFYNFDEPQSGYYQELVPLIKTLDSACLLKATAVSTTLNDINFEYTKTTEISNVKATTAILFLNTTNSKLVISGEEESIDCVENTLVEIDSSKTHTITSCTDNSRNIVLKINFVKLLNE